MLTVPSNNPVVCGIMRFSDNTEFFCRVTASVLPQDKAFAPGLFLSLVHHNVGFEALTNSLPHLQSFLEKQSSARENLVRSNFGLFIDCAEDLKWLKAYRTGTHIELELENSKKGRKQSVIASNVSSNGAGSGRRASILRTDNPSMTSSLLESGEAKLMRAEKSLDKAKSEAQSTLAPILERMRKGRRIRSTEQVLKRLAATLEYPHKMQLALENNDYDEVINIYTRVSSLQTSSTSLKILQRVRSNAEAVVMSLKEKCVSSLMCSDPSFATVAKNTKVLQDLLANNPSAYLPLLKQSFDTQLKNFRAAVDKIVIRYVDEVESIQGRINEGDVYPSKSTGNVGAPGYNSYTSPLMNPTSTAMPIPRRSSGSNIKNTLRFDDEVDFNDAQSVGGASVGGGAPSRTGASVREQNGGFELFEEVLFGRSTNNASANNNLEDDYFSGGQSFRMGASNMNSSQRLQAPDTYSDSGNDVNDTDYFPMIDGADIDVNSLSSGSATQQQLLEARISFLEQLIDCVDTWLPTLHRLVTDVTKLSSSVATNSHGPRSSIAMVQRDSGLSPARRFCEQLTHCCDCIREALCGLALVTTNSAAGASNRPGNSSGSGGGNTAANRVTGIQLCVSADRLDIPIFTAALPEPHYSNALRAIAELYDGVSSVIQTNRLILCHLSFETTDAFNTDTLALSFSQLRR
jgi:hypothetical protein